MSSWWSDDYNTHWIEMFCSRCAARHWRSRGERLALQEPLYCLPCFLFVVVGSQLKGARE